MTWYLEDRHIVVEAPDETTEAPRAAVFTPVLTRLFLTLGITAGALLLGTLFASTASAHPLDDTGDTSVGTSASALTHGVHASVATTLSAVAESGITTLDHTLLSVVGTLSQHQAAPQAHPITLPIASPITLPPVLGPPRQAPAKGTTAVGKPAVKHPAKTHRTTAVTTAKPAKATTKAKPVTPRHRSHDAPAPVAAPVLGGDEQASAPGPQSPPETPTAPSTPSVGVSSAHDSSGQSRGSLAVLPADAPLAPPVPIGSASTRAHGAQGRDPGLPVTSPD